MPNPAFRKYRNMRQQYTQWNNSGPGELARQARLVLLRHLLSGWPRRSRSVLVMHPEQRLFAEVLYENGFDVTCLEDDQTAYNRLCAVRKKHLPCTLAPCDHLPFEDHSFDFTVVVSGIEYWADPLAVLGEIRRVTCGGCIILFTNKHSLFCAETALAKKWGHPTPHPPAFTTPARVQRLALQAFGNRSTAFASVLYGCTSGWKESLAQSRPFVCAIPLGAFAGLRVDFAPMVTGTMLPVCTSTAISPAK